MNHEQPAFRKAVLKIDCKEQSTGDTTAAKSAGQQQNLAARRALEQGGAAAGGNAGNRDMGEIAVQYNPASIKYRASVTESGRVKYENQGTRNCQITSVSGESTVNISFSLLFHSRYSGDQSVREQMERIMDMIRRSSTKQVEFAWSNIQIAGRLVSFSGEYDMFDSLGVPISGHMDMSIETSVKPEPTDKTVDALEANS